MVEYGSTLPMPSMSTGTSRCVACCTTTRTGPPSPPRPRAGPADAPPHAGTSGSATHRQDSPPERQRFSPGIVGSSKNVGFDPTTGKLGGTVLDGQDRHVLAEMISRYADSAAALLDALLPSYRGRVIRGRTSFRPVEIAGRKT